MDSSQNAKEQMEYEKAVHDAEMRKVFPTLDEQMDKLAPELQVELFNIEEEYDKGIELAKTVRQDILDTKHDLFEANTTCSQMVYATIDTRRKKITELREKWGNFFYNNQR